MRAVYKNVLVCEVLTRITKIGEFLSKIISISTDTSLCQTSTLSSFTALEKVNIGAKYSQWPEEDLNKMLKPVN